MSEKDYDFIIWATILCAIVVISFFLGLKGYGYFQYKIFWMPFIIAVILLIRHFLTVENYIDTTKAAPTKMMLCKGGKVILFQYIPSSDSWTLFLYTKTVKDRREDKDAVIERSGQVHYFEGMNPTEDAHPISLKKGLSREEANYILDILSINYDKSPFNAEVILRASNFALNEDDFFKRNLYRFIVWAYDYLIFDIRIKCHSKKFNCIEKNLNQYEASTLFEKQGQ